MRIEVETSGVKQTTWHEFAIRFLFGGLATAAVGIVGRVYGPSVAGLFLAFPAIFPCSATLLAKHEREKKQKAGLDGSSRGSTAASLDAAGAAIGSIGLLGFALLVWRFMPGHNAVAVLAGAALVWMGISYAAWIVRKAA